jgi:hemerythrin
MALHWTSALSVGVPALDDQHRELFRRVDRLLDAMLRNDRTEAARLLLFLREYAIVHFAAEEQLMWETGYPDATRHSAEHQSFSATLRSLDADFREHGATAPLVLQLERHAVGWLRDHVYFTDVALGRWVKTHRAGASAPRT